MRRILAHMFDNSACLSKRQLRDYVNGTMADEECYVVERHANDCAFCSEALEGLSTQGAQATTYLETFSSEFLHDHFQSELPPVHLNSIAAPSTIPNPAKPRGTSIS